MIDTHGKTPHALITKYDSIVSCCKHCNALHVRVIWEAVCKHGACGLRNSQILLHAYVLWGHGLGCMCLHHAQQWNLCDIHASSSKSFQMHLDLFIYVPVAAACVDIPFLSSWCWYQQACTESLKTSCCFAWIGVCHNLSIGHDVRLTGDRVGRVLQDIFCRKILEVLYCMRSFENSNEVQPAQISLRNATCSILQCRRRRSFASLCNHMAGMTCPRASAGYVWAKWWAYVATTLVYTNCRVNIHAYMIILYSPCHCVAYAIRLLAGLKHVKFFFFWHCWLQPGWALAFGALCMLADIAVNRYQREVRRRVQ